MLEAWVIRQDPDDGELRVKLAGERARAWVRADDAHAVIDEAAPGLYKRVMGQYVPAVTPIARGSQRAAIEAVLAITDAPYSEATREGKAANEVLRQVRAALNAALMPNAGATS